MTPTDPECSLERELEDGEAEAGSRRLRKRLLSPEEGKEGEEDDEEAALHSCDSCRQVFESLSDLTEHKINQCQLTGKQRSAHRALLHFHYSSALPLPFQSPHWRISAYTVCWVQHTPHIRDFSTSLPSMNSACHEIGGCPIRHTIQMERGQQPISLFITTIITNHTHTENPPYFCNNRSI